MSLFFIAYIASLRLCFTNLFCLALILCSFFLSYLPLVITCSCLFPSVAFFCYLLSPISLSFFILRGSLFFYCLLLLFSYFIFLALYLSFPCFLLFLSCFNLSQLSCPFLLPSILNALSLPFLSLTIFLVSCSVIHSIIYMFHLYIFPFRFASSLLLSFLLLLFSSYF